MVCVNCILVLGFMHLSVWGRGGGGGGGRETERIVTGREIKPRNAKPSIISGHLNQRCKTIARIVLALASQLA